MFVDSPVEQTTAVTDLFLALQSVAVIVMLRKVPMRKPMRTDVWTRFFGLLEGCERHGMWGRATQ